MRSVALLLLLSTPAHASFYLDLGLLASTNRYHHSGSNPLFDARLGYEYKSFAVELNHRCSLFDGSPFNNRDDFRQNNSIGVYWRIRF